MTDASGEKAGKSFRLLGSAVAAPNTGYVRVRIEAREDQSLSMATPMTRAKRARLIDEEHHHTARWHYLSFATDCEFLGAAIVRAHGVITATQRAADLGINPGGEVMCQPIPRKEVPRVPADLRNRLLSAEEVLKRLGGKTVGK